MRGRTYKFTDKHHHCSKSDHGCWLNEITRDIEFSLFQDPKLAITAMKKRISYNVHKNGEEFIEIGTRHEFLAIFWNPQSAAEWHGHPLWPIKTREALNRRTKITSRLKRSCGKWLKAVV